MGFIKNNIDKFIGDVSFTKAGVENLISKAKGYKPKGFYDGCKNTISYDNEMIMRHLYYKGKMKYDLINILKDMYPKSYQKMQPYTLRLLTKYINRSAGLYINSPERQLLLNGKALDDTDKNVMEYNRFVSVSNFDRYFKQQNRLSRLFKTSFGRVSFDEKLQVPVWNIFPPYCLERVPHPDKPSDINSDYYVILKLSAGDSFYENFGDTDRYEIWKNENFDEAGLVARWTRYIISGDGVIQIEEPNHEFLPVTVIYDEEPSEPFINGGDDLLDTARSVNVLLTDMKFISQYQAHSQLVLRTDNPKGDSQLAVGADKTTLLPTSDNLEVLDFNPKISELSGIGKDLIYLFAIMNNMSPNQFRVDRQSLTGVALKVENLDLMEDRQDKIALFKNYENEHFEKTILCHNTYSNNEYSDGLGLQWTAGDPDIISDDEAKMRIWQQEKREGVSDNIQWLMEKNNINEEEATNFLQNLKNRKTSDADNLFGLKIPVNDNEEIIT